MCISGQAPSRFVTTATTPFTESSRCLAGMRREKDTGGVAKAVCRSAGCVEHGGLSADQPLALRRPAQWVTHPTAKVADCGRRKAGCPPLSVYQSRRLTGAKDKATKCLEPVAWHYDHNESQKGKPRYKNGICFLACTVRVGEHVATVDLRIYLREKTVRRLNRNRAVDQRLPFLSKNSLARMILEALRPLLPAGWQVYVQFDSWYASKRLIKYVLRQGWHVICALKYNRLLDGLRLDKHAHAMRHRHYTRVRVTATDNQKTTYFVRRQEGRLADIPRDVRVFFSKRHPWAHALAYILCTDLSCSANLALQGYCWRWSCEVVNFYTKTQLGLTDFRVQSYEAVDKYMVVVHLAWAYV